MVSTGLAPAPALVEQSEAQGVPASPVPSLGRVLKGWSAKPDTFSLSVDSVTAML